MPIEDDLRAFLILFLSTGVLVLAGIALLRWLDSRHRAEIAALAARRGLMLERLSSGRGRSGGWRFTDTARGLTLSIAYGTRGRGGHSLLALSQPRLAGGLAVWTGGLPAGLDGQLAQLGDLAGGRLMQALLGRLLGDEIAPHLPDLSPLPMPPGLAALASVPAESLPPPAPIAAALEALPRAKGRHTFAVLTASGLSLRLPVALAKPGEIDAMLDAGITLHAALR